MLTLQLKNVSIFLLLWCFQYKLHLIISQNKEISGLLAVVVFPQDHFLHGAKPLLLTDTRLPCECKRLVFMFINFFFQVKTDVNSIFPSCLQSGTS